MIFPSLRFFVLESLLIGIPAVLGCFATADGHISDDYALITARSGWMPMIFMTRVRL